MVDRLALLVGDRLAFLERLAIAETHVVQRARHLRRQRETVSSLALGGQDASFAYALLCELQEAYFLSVDTRDRRLRELQTLKLEDRALQSGPVVPPTSRDRTPR